MYSAADVLCISDVPLLPVSETTENHVSSEYWDNELVQMGMVYATQKIASLLKIM